MSILKKTVNQMTSVPAAKNVDVVGNLAAQQAAKINARNSTYSAAGYDDSHDNTVMNTNAGKTTTSSSSSGSGTKKTATTTSASNNTSNSSNNSYSGGGGSSSNDDYVETQSYFDDGAAALAAANALRDSINNLYSTNATTVKNTYAEQLAKLKENYESAKGVLDTNLATDEQKETTSAEDQLREAYIAKMLAQKDLQDQMAALGLTGGATESTLAKMINNYNTNRNTINREKDTNLTSLRNKYAEQLASALQDYNTKMNTANANQTADLISIEQKRIAALQAAGLI